MGRQWRTQYPLSDRTVRQLRRARRLNIAIALVMLTNFTLELASGHRDWWVWSGGLALVMFVGSIFLTTHQLRRSETPLTRTPS